MGRYRKGFKSMTKVLVTGAAGMLGTAIKEMFTDYDLLLTDKEELDITSYKQVEKYADCGIDLIINLAAITDLEQCERNPVLAFSTNKKGVYNIKKLCLKLDIPIVHISTAGIFNGEKHVYTETDKPQPLNQYGLSKLLGEQQLYDYKKSYIFRCSWMMGGGVNIDKKFINKVFTQLLDGKKEIKVYPHIIGSPTYTLDVARSIKKAIELNIPYGIYNCAGEGVASRYEVAKLFIKYLGIKGVKVIKAHKGELKDMFPCVRSTGEVLCNNKLIATGASCMRDWQITLKEYTEKCFKPYLNFTR